jgi:hypothetical protein
MEDANKGFEPEEEPKVTEENQSETPLEIASTGVASVDWMKAKWAKFQSYTKKQASDSIWLLGVKLFFQAIGILILIILSPFVLFGILIAFLVAT